MSTGILAVNAFLSSPKFDEAHDQLIQAAADEGISLQLRTGAQLHTELPNAEWVLFQDKDIALARRLESAGLRVFNSAEAIRVCDDKTLTYVELAGQGLAQPETIIVPLRYEKVDFSSHSFVDHAIENLSLPLIGKHGFGSFGVGVFLLNTREEVVEFLNDLGTSPGLLQRYVRQSHGKDRRLQVVGNRVIAAIERSNDTGDFRANLTNGGQAIPTQPTAEEESLALEATRALGLDFAGVDLLHSEDGPLICEVNSNAHVVNISRITNINVARHMIKHIVEVTHN